MILYNVDYTWCIQYTYNVMQSDVNSFGGDVVLDSLDMLYSDEDTI